MTDRRDVLISKALSYLLRHGALKERLPIDRNGYIAVDELLKHTRLKSLKCNEEDIHRVVQENDKKRFHLKTDEAANGEVKEFICATQGHSINTINPDQEVLKQIKLQSDIPDKLVHGTTISKMLLILQSGSIKKVNRNHIHLAPGVTGMDKQVVSGMRSSSNVHIYLKTSQELLDTIKLYKSLNDVYLSPEDINISLFEKVTIRPAKASSDASKLLAPLVKELEKHQIPYQLIDRIESHQ